MVAAFALIIALLAIPEATPNAYLHGQVSVERVSGRLRGPCKERRRREVQEALNRLSGADLWYTNECRCNYESVDEALASVHGYNAVVPRRSSKRWNVVFVTLSRPGYFPERKPPLLTPPVAALILEGLPGWDYSLVLVGHREEPGKRSRLPPSRDGLLYKAYTIRGDRFGLSRPGREC